MAALGAIVARNVRAERARRGWKQSELGDRLGWAISTVSAVETGRRKLAVDDLPALCRAFGISLTKLLDGAPPEDLDSLHLERVGAGSLPDTADLGWHRLVMWWFW